MIDGSNIWRESPVHAKYCAINQAGQRQIIKNFRTVFPRVGTTVLAEAFVIKAVNLDDFEKTQ